MIVHTVLMRFADPCDAETAREFLAEMAERVEHIESMTLAVDRSVGDGTNEPAPRFHLRMTTTHPSARALAAYRDDPAHRVVAAWLHPRLTDRAVVDEQS